MNNLRYLPVIFQKQTIVHMALGCDRGMCYSTIYWEVEMSKRMAQYIPKKERIEPPTLRHKRNKHHKGLYSQ